MTQEPSRHGIAEHHQMNKLIETLASTDFSSPGWLTTAKELHHKIYHHLEDEEKGVFQLAGKVLSEAQKLSLGERLRRRVRLAARQGVNRRGSAAAAFTCQLLTILRGLPSSSIATYVRLASVTLM